MVMLASFYLKLSRKFILSSFIAIALLQTPYVQKKLEKGIGYVLYRKLQKSKLQGLRSLSLNHWHIDYLKLIHPDFGTLVIEDIDFTLKYTSLLFGKLNFQTLRARSLEMLIGDDTPFNPYIFQILYKTKPLLADQLFIESVQTTWTPVPFSLRYTKKQRLTFLELIEKGSPNHVFFEIPRYAPFLKFKLDLLYMTPYGQALLQGAGEVANRANLKLSGSLEFPFTQLPIPLRLEGSYDTSIEIHGSLKSESLESAFHFDEKNLTGELRCIDFSKFWPGGPLSGDLTLQWKGSWDELKAQGHSNVLYFRRKALAPLHFTAQIDPLKSLSLEGAFLEAQEACLTFNFEGLKQGTAYKAKLDLKGTPIEASLETEWTCDSGKLTPAVFQSASQIHDFKFFEGLFENLSLSGEGSLAYNYHHLNKSEEIWGAFNHCKVNEIGLDQARIHFQQNEDLGHVDIEFKQLKTPIFEPISCCIKGTKQGVWDLFSKIDSAYFDLSLNQKLAFFPQGFLYDLHDLHGTLFSKPLTLEKPVIIEKTSEVLKISALNLHTDACSFKYEAEENPQRLFHVLEITSLPLLGWKIPHFELPVEGTLTLKATLDSLDLSKSQIELAIDAFKLKSSCPLFPPFFVRGHMRGGSDGFGYELSHYFVNDDLIVLSGHFPHVIHPKSSLELFTGPSHHTLTCRYDLKDLGRFIDLGQNTLGGKVVADLYFKRHPEGLFTSGFLETSDLYAGFPLLGIYTQNGNFKLKAYGKTGEFALQIQDLQGGKGSASGLLDLNTLNYRASVNFEQFYLKIKDLFQANLFGNLQTQGDFHQLNAKGLLQLEKGKYELIHEELSRKKTYLIEKLIHDLPPSPIDSFHYHLDMDLKTLNPLKITGAGLDSDWVGQSHCLFTPEQFSLEGTLTCNKGDFRFSSKKFVIDEGTITLSEKNPSTIVAKGHLDLPAYQIKILLLGPIAEPTLSFSSLPYLSEKAIFSYILFNKPPMELHPYQSLELAQTLMELSGDKTPFSLNYLKSSLNIDTLEIVSGESTKNPLTLRVGKYLKPGFLIALTQNAKTSDMLVQLELKHGFLIKAESKEQKEGKFSLSWHTNF